MPRNEIRVYDKDANALPPKPRRSHGALGTLVAGLGVLAVLAGGGWAFHHYHPRQFAKIFSLPGQDPVIQRKDAEERWLYASPSPARNAKLSALEVSVLQVRPLAGTSVGGTPGIDSADLELRLTNPTDHAIQIGNALYFSTSCKTFFRRQIGYTLSEPSWLPAGDTIWSVAHHLPGGVQNPGNLYLSLGPHQTKVGWAGIAYMTDCGAQPHELIISDSSLLSLGASVTRRFLFPPLGSPIGPPATGS